MQVTHLKTTPKTTEGSLCQVPNEGWVITATRIGKEEVISSKMFKVNAVKSKWAPLVFPWSVYSPTILEAYHHLSLQTSDVNPSLHVLNWFLSEPENKEEESPWKYSPPWPPSYVPILLLGPRSMFLLPELCACCPFCLERSSPLCSHDCTFIVFQLEDVSYQPVVTTPYKTAIFHLLRCAFSPQPCQNLTYHIFTYLISTACHLNVCSVRGGTWFYSLQHPSHLDPCLVHSRHPVNIVLMNEVEFDLEAKKRHHFWREGRKDIPDCGKEGKSKCMDMGLVMFRKVRNSLQLKKKERKRRWGWNVGWWCIKSLDGQSKPIQT